MASLGDLSGASVSGARCARTIRATVAPGILSPRPCRALARYRWGEDGLLGFCDDQMRVVLRPGAVERSDPHPQGAALRPDRHAGQPRRGRQGVLLLPGRHADSLVHEGALQVSAARLPYDELRAENRATRTARPECELLDTGIFATTATSTSTVEYAKAQPRRHPDPDHRHQPRPEPAPLHLLPTLWFRNTWSWGRDDARPSPDGASPGEALSGSSSRDARHATGLRGDGPAAAAVHRERDQRLSACGGAQSHPLHEGRVR